MGLVLNKFHFLLEQLEWKEVGEVGKIHLWEFWFLKKKSHFFPRFEPFGSSSCPSWDPIFPSSSGFPAFPRFLLSTKKSELSGKNWSTTVPKKNPKKSQKSQGLGDPREKTDWEIHGKIHVVCFPWNHQKSTLFSSWNSIFLGFFLVGLPPPELKSKIQCE